jgi:hypothetical protein
VTVWPGGQLNPSEEADGGDSVCVPTRLPFLSAVKVPDWLSWVTVVVLLEACRLCQR